MISIGILKKSVKVLFIRGAGVLLLFMLSLFLTNFYSPEDVGRYDFVRATIMILSGASLIGTNQSIIYYSGVLKSKNSLSFIKNIYYKMVKMTGLICLLFLLAGAMISEQMINELFNKKDAYDLILSTIVALFFYTITMLNIDTLRALDKTIVSELYRNIFRYLPVFVFSIALFFAQKQEWLIEVFLGGFLLLFIATTIQTTALFKKFKDKTTNDNRFSYTEIFKRSYPMALSTVAYFIMQSVDIIILTAYEGYDKVAYYSIAVKLATVTALALMSVNIVVAPKIAEIYNNNDHGKLNKLIKDSSRIIFSISSFFGENYVLAKDALSILLAAQFFSSICGPGAIYLNMTGKQQKLNKILIAGLFINVILNFVLIPSYGIEGAAIATLISMLFWNSLIVSVIYKSDKIKIFIT